MRPLTLTGLLVALLAATMLSVPPQRASADNPIDAQVNAIASELQCPICSGQSVNESTSPLAQQMRLLIRKKLEDGESREQILAYFVDRYGESILREPPKVGFNQLLWLLPGSILLVGSVLLAFFLLRWRNRPAACAAGGAPPTPEDLAAFEQQLA
ncbi:MAG: cytochrome c-type biogenesis protein [Chloroflexota bacterium]